MGALRAMTAQELLRYGNEPSRTELLAGTLVEMEPAGALHGVVVARICRLLSNHVVAHELGEVFGAETGFQLASDPDTVRAPDAAFVSRERIAAVGIPNGYWPGSPDIAFEVISPRDPRREVDDKTRSWLQAGARAVVVLEPRRRTATIHRIDGSSCSYDGCELLRLDDVLPGFGPAVEDLFA